MAYTFDEVANILGVHRDTLARWKRQGCSELDEPPYDPEAVALWRRNRNKKRKSTFEAPKETATGNLTEQRLQADIELKRVRRRIAEFDLMIKQGELVLGEDVKQSQARLASEIKKHLLRIPDSYADSITNLQTIGEAKEILEQVVFDTLALLSKGAD